MPPKKGSHHVREAVNECEVKAALREITRGYGAMKLFAEQHGLNPDCIVNMVCNTTRISVPVAAALGYELRWVKKEVVSAKV